MSPKTDEGDEYDIPEDLLGEPLTPHELALIEDGLQAVRTSEAHQEWHKGNHYYLAEILRTVLGVHATKENMKQIAQEALDSGRKPRKR